MSNTITTTTATATLTITAATATDLTGLLALQDDYLAAASRVDRATSLRDAREAHLLVTVALSVAAWRGASVAVKDCTAMVKDVSTADSSPLARRLPSGDRAIVALAAIGNMATRNGGNDADLGNAATVASVLDTLAWVQQARRGDARWAPANVAQYVAGFETLAPMIEDLATIRERIATAESAAKDAAKAESDAAPTVALLAGNAASIVAGIRKRLDAGEILTDADCAGIEALKLAVAAL